jgi:dTDP-4-amino-4,6-dideoxygalactose transaminase
MSNEKIWLSSPHMSGEELKYVHEAFDTNWVAPVGPHIAKFEEQLADYVGVGHCAVLSSGTAAIHLALIILGVQRNDEVLCQSFTFSGSCNPIVYLGAKPVFVDSEFDTWNMDPSLLREAIEDRIKKTSKKPKAVIAVHLYGMPARIDKIVEVCQQYEIPLIEDAAEALGASLNGKKMGAFGDFSILSFNGNKIITTSGGGALLANNESWIQKARFLATQARDKAVHYEHSQIGYNYRLSNVCAGIGIGQLTVLDQRVNQRRSIFEKYRTSLRDLKSIQFLDEPEGHISNRWLTTVLINPNEGHGASREDVRIALDKVNIESRPLWKPMHQQPVFEGCAAVMAGVSDQLFKNGLCLPSGSNLSNQDLERVISVVREVVT